MRMKNGLFACIFLIMPLICMAQGKITIIEPPDGAVINTDIVWEQLVNIEVNYTLIQLDTILISGSVFHGIDAWHTVPHEAVDLRAYYEDIFAPYDGEIIESKFDSLNGNYIKFYIPCLNITLGFAHLQNRMPKGWYYAGSYLGTSGNTGHTEAPHIHFTTRIGKNPGGKRVDPKPYLFGQYHPLTNLTLDITPSCSALPEHEEWDVSHHNFWNGLSGRDAASNKYDASYNWYIHTCPEGNYTLNTKLFSICRCRPPFVCDSLEDKNVNIVYLTGPRLVILPTYSNVDVRVMDIYDYPVSDPCERASAPIAGLGFGTRGRWNAAFHSIRQRWPEPFKCYQAEGIIVGTPGYEVECYPIIQCTRNCDMIEFNYDYDIASGIGNWSINFSTDDVDVNAGNMKIRAEIPEAGISASRDLPIMFSRTVGLERANFGSAELTYSLSCYAHGKYGDVNVDCVSTCSQPTAEDFLYKRIWICGATADNYDWQGLGEGETWEANGIYEYRSSTPISCGMITGFEANSSISGTIYGSANCCDWKPCADCPENMGIDCGIGLNLEVICPDGCGYNPYVDISQINTDDPSGGDFGPEVITLIPKLDDETRSFVETVYGNVPNLVVTDNIIEHTRYSKVAYSDTVAKPDESSKLPKSISLLLFPNPTNSTVEIEMYFPSEQEAELFAVDVLGRKVWQQTQREYPQGTTSLRWEINNNLPSGVYYIIIQSGGQKTEGKIYLIR